jgi:aspartate aminotransferase-like enzyme
MKRKKYIYTPGPVPMSQKILKIGARQLPYFRTEQFSQAILECKRNLLELVDADSGAEVIFLGSSGTGAMEATVMNLLSEKNRAIVINGGGFGQRFIDICDGLGIQYYNVRQHKNEAIDFISLQKFDADTFIINAHETTIGRLYDLKQAGQFCHTTNKLFIVDAISAFVCDEISMRNQHIDALIISSNKGLALPPGLGIVVLSSQAIARLQKTHSTYFDFSRYIEDMKRGQTPYTPPISIILQLQARLVGLKSQGIGKVNGKTRKLAKYFREKIKNLPLKNHVNDMSNGMTTLCPTDGKLATKIIHDLEQRYDVVLAPSAGNMKESVIRVSNMGHVNKEYMDVLIRALQSYYGVKQ